MEQHGLFVGGRRTERWTYGNPTTECRVIEQIIRGSGQVIKEQDIVANAELCLPSQTILGSQTNFVCEGNRRIGVFGVDKLHTIVDKMLSLIHI